MSWIRNTGFYDAKSVFIAVNASLRWLSNVVGVYLVQVSLFLIGQQQGLGHFFRYRYRPLLPIWLEDCENFTPTREENNKYSANYFWCNTNSKPIHFYQYTIICTPLVIRENDKNKQLTLLSHRGIDRKKYMPLKKSISWDSPLKKNSKFTILYLLYCFCLLHVINKEIFSSKGAIVSLYPPKDTTVCMYIFVVQARAEAETGGLRLWLGPGPGLRAGPPAQIRRSAGEEIQTWKYKKRKVKRTLL